MSPVLAGQDDGIFMGRAYVDAGRIVFLRSEASQFAVTKVVTQDYYEIGSH